MKVLKVILQGVVTVALFFSIWYFLGQVNWMEKLQVKKATDKTEEKLGDLFKEVIEKSERENKDPKVTRIVDSIIHKILRANDIDSSSVKVHVLEKDEVNAFAFPGGHLVVYTGLINASDNPEELAGVVGHEIAHIQLNHVMKKLVKEFGLSAIIAISSGNAGQEIVKEATRSITSSAFDRSLEREADIKAVDYLGKAGINPGPFADFMYKLSADNSDSDQYLSWISTHPDSKERAEYIVEYGKKYKPPFTKCISDSSWNNLRKNILIGDEDWFSDQEK